MYSIWKLLLLRHLRETSVKNYNCNMALWNRIIAIQAKQSEFKFTSFIKATASYYINIFTFIEFIGQATLKELIKGAYILWLPCTFGQFNEFSLMYLSAVVIRNQRHHHGNKNSCCAVVRRWDGRGSGTTIIWSHNLMTTNP